MTHPTLPSKSLLTVEQLAALLAVPQKTIYSWRYKGTGPRAVSVGRHIRFRQEDVAAWLEQHADEARAVGAR